jgi:hypothetical protein
MKGFIAGVIVTIVAEGAIAVTILANKMMEGGDVE